MNQEPNYENINEQVSQAFHDAAEIMRRVHIAFFYRGVCTVQMFLDSNANFYHASAMLCNPTPESIQKIVDDNTVLRARLEEELSNAPVRQKPFSRNRRRKSIA